MMFKSFIKSTFRNMLKQRDYSLINLFGLTLGMTTCILILLYVRYELNWNTSHEKSDRIYRVQQKVLFKDNFDIWGQTGYPLAEELKRNLPEFEATTVMREVWGEYLSSSDDLTFEEGDGYYAHNSLFDIFTFHFLAGDPKTALSEPFTIVLTKELADKYFPEGDALGKMIKASQNKLLKVTGVVENLPFNEDTRPDYLVSFQTFDQVTGWPQYKDLANITSAAFRTFVLLKEKTSLKSVNEKIYHFADQYSAKNYKKLYLKPILEMHITADETNDIKQALYYQAGISIFVLLLACINFINLATANSSLRKKEIGIRKVVGSNKTLLFFHFVGEFLIYSLVSIVLAFTLAQFILPFFSAIVQRPLELDFGSNSLFFLFLLGLFIATALLAGIYPALFLSSFQPIDILKGNIGFTSSGKPRAKKFVRRFLVTFQFAISVTIIISTIYVSKQVQYMKNKYLGFEKEHLLLCHVSGESPTGRFESLKSQLLRHNNIQNVTVSVNVPFRGSWGRDINWQGCAPDDKLNTRYNRVGYDFLDTFQMQLKQGRNFSRDYSTDNTACLVNEEMVRQIGWDNPLGKKIDNDRYTIVGVVKDFHPFSVHEKIPPYYMVLHPDKLDAGSVYTIRVHNIDTDETITFVNRTFRSFFPDAIIDTHFFTKKLRYGTEDVWEVLAKIFFSFAIIAVLIAANGLYGLVSFAVQRRIKEVGIRKVLGSSASQLYYLISKEFLLLLLIATMISCPIGYIVSITTPGAYKYSLQPHDYAVSIIFMLFTAIAATVYHTTKAILAKPSETLRYE